MDPIRGTPASDQFLVKNGHNVAGYFHKKKKKENTDFFDETNQFLKKRFVNCGL